MAISLQAIRELRALITSDRVAYKGNEVMLVAGIVSELDHEEKILAMAQRVVPLGPAPGVATEVKEG